jgi:hypothetical protein
MVANVLPFRAIVLQCLLLTVAIAIESTLLGRAEFNRQSLTPRQSIQYATTINLLSTVLGWFTLFALFDLEALLPVDWTQALQTGVLNFIFFTQLSNESLSFMIVLAFITFFVSFAVKLVTLWGLKWLVQSEFPQALSESEVDPAKGKLNAMGLRDLRKYPRQPSSSYVDITTVLIANAWSYTAILMILLILSLQFRV